MPSVYRSRQSRLQLLVVQADSDSYIANFNNNAQNEIEWSANKRSEQEYNEQTNTTHKKQTDSQTLIDPPRIQKTAQGKKEENNQPNHKHVQQKNVTKIAKQQVKQKRKQG